MEERKPLSRLTHGWTGRVRWLAFVFAALIATALPVPEAAAREESCITCHRDPDFQVTNKKLYDYYRDWSQSAHALEGIECSDCHGGNPKAPGKKEAHGAKGIGASVRSSPVNYRNIPETCAPCHEAFYDNYRLSAHFKHLTKLADEKGQRQGPNCVTCHLSVSTEVLNVNTVRNTCERCHNEKTGNHPEIPDKAEFLLNKFLSIHRFYRYLTVKGSVLNEQEIFKQIEERTTHLFIEWHTFDLKEVERKTEGLLTVLKEKRNEIRKQLRARRQ
jgi:hypothetical protein